MCVCVCVCVCVFEKHIIVGRLLRNIHPFTHSHLFVWLLLLFYQYLHTQTFPRPVSLPTDLPPIHNYVPPCLSLYHWTELSRLTSSLRISFNKSLRDLLKLSDHSFNRPSSFRSWINHSLPQAGHVPRDLIWSNTGINSPCKSLCFRWVEKRPDCCSWDRGG